MKENPILLHKQVFKLIKSILKPLVTAFESYRLTT